MIITNYYPSKISGPIRFSSCVMTLFMDSFLTTALTLKPALIKAFATALPWVPVAPATNMVLFFICLYILKSRKLFCIGPFYNRCF
jgi:hypothetical protein